MNNNMNLFFLKTILSKYSYIVKFSQKKATDGIGWLSRYNRDRRDLGASIVFKIPIYRDIILWLGMVDAGINTAKQILSQGKSLYILPGGVMEQMLTIEGRHRVFINTRKGFARLAVEYGTDLIPVYTFGETNLYSVSDFLINFRLWVCKKFQIALPIFFYSKRGGVPILFLSHQVPLVMCIGKPIPVNKMSPTCPEFSAYVDQKHKEFVDALQCLFDKYKVECGYPDAQLEILPKKEE